MGLEAPEHALIALSKVGTTDDGVAECLRAHLPAAVLNRIKQVTEAPLQGGMGSKLRIAASECLSQLCHHQFGKVQVLEQLPGEKQISGVEALTRLLKAPEWLVRKNTAKAMMGLTVEVSAKVGFSPFLGWLVACQVEGPIGLCLSQPFPSQLPVARQACLLLLKMLKGDDLEMAENARQVLINCKEHPDAAAQIFSVMSKDEWKDTFGRGPGPYDEYGYFLPR